MDVPHYWTADQVKRLLGALASHNRHQARTAVLIMWRTGLRVSEVLELEWRDLDYLSAHADTTAAVIVRYRAMLALTLMLTLWAHGPDPQAARIRPQRQGLPPLNGTLRQRQNLIAGRPGQPLDPSSDRERRKTTSAGGISSLEPKLSI